MGLNEERRQRRKRNNVPEPSQTESKTGNHRVASSKSEKNGNNSLSKGRRARSTEMASTPVGSSSRNEKLRPSLPKDLANEIRQNFVIRRSKQLRERKRLISQVVKRRRINKSIEELNQKPIQSNTKQSIRHGDQRRRGKNKVYNDNVELETKRSIEESSITSKIETSSKEVASESTSTKIVTRGGPAATCLETNNEKHGELYASKMECARLKMEKKAINRKIVAADAQISLLQQHISDLTAETELLRKQLDKWQTKSKRLSELQTKERAKFDNSSDLIAQARIGLTKALNDASNLEAKIFDLERAVEERDRRLDDLYDTIERKTEIVQEMNTKLKDRETVLRLTENENRILQDEVEVLIASKKGRDMGKILGRLERERDKWLRDREQQIEVARIDLEKEKDRILERENFRHRQELDIAADIANKRKHIEEKQHHMQDFVNQQLEDMRKANRELEEKLTNDREESNFEIREQDSTIADLEFEVNDLKKQLKYRNRSDKELQYRKAEVDSMKEELRDARKQNSLLEDKLSKLLSRPKTVLETKERKQQKSPRISEKSQGEFFTSHTKEHKIKMEHEKKEKLKATNSTPGKKTLKKSKKKKPSNKKKSNRTGNKKQKKKKQSKNTKRSIGVSSMKVLKEVHGRNDMSEILSSEGELFQLRIPPSIVCVPVQ